MANISRNIRGGSRYDGVGTSYITYCRNWHLLDCQVHNLGFRCVYPVNNNPATDVCVLHGGSQSSGFPNLFRCAYRLIVDPDNRRDRYGFRCVYPVLENKV